MKRPTIVPGIALSFGILLVSLPIWWVVGAGFSSLAALRWILLVSQWSYLVFLLKATRPPRGSLTLGALNLALGLGLMLLPWPAILLCLVWAGWISLNRCLLLQRSLPAVGLDLLIGLLGFFFFRYLLDETLSVPTAVWGFFLIQSLAGSIPARLGRGSPAPDYQDLDPFQAPFRQAQSALDQILEEN